MVVISPSSPIPPPQPQQHHQISSNHQISRFEMEYFGNGKSHYYHHGISQLLRLCDWWRWRWISISTRWEWIFFYLNITTTTPAPRTYGKRNIVLWCYKGDKGWSCVVWWWLYMLRDWAMIGTMKCGENECVCWICCCIECFVIYCVNWELWENLPPNLSTSPWVTLSSGFSARSVSCICFALLLI